jgi:two-component system osmolarity sensor histidine kinase EnvZ
MSSKYLPKSLFARALLILVLPTLFIQLITAYIFFDRHWENVTRHMSGALAGEVAFLIKQLKDVPAKQKPQVVDEFESATGIRVYFEAKEAFNLKKSSGDFPEFQQLLHSKITEAFTVRKIKDGEYVEIQILLPSQSLKIITNTKRLESRTTIIFMGWMIGSSALFLFIAIIFLRNQIRPITRLALAADNFGRGVDTPGFRPHGASEVRKAARAFIVMRERIRRQIRTRTDMLSGISHDLRTPLTRMKLQLAMLPDDVSARDDMREAIGELSDDVQQMQNMIKEYLDFARDGGREEAVKVQLAELLEDVVNDYKRMQHEVELTIENQAELDLRVSACRRMLHNLIDNALRYGKRCHLTLRVTGSYAGIIVDDEGDGIPEEKREEVFKPFSRLEPSRNNKTGGVGLGLTIARDVVLAHGGSIGLETAPSGGLRVYIRLPI